MRKSDFIGLRVDPAIARKLKEVAACYGVGRSTLVRELLESCDVVYPILKDEKLKQDTAALEKQVLDSLKNRVPESMNPMIVEMVGQMVNRIMTQLAERMIAEKEVAEPNK